MSDDRLGDHLDHLRFAAREALIFVEGLDTQAFMADRRTQQAVAMNLILIGEEASKILANHREFTVAHPEIDWRAIRGMRNRIAHNYVEISFDTVWLTLETWIPELLEQLDALSPRP